MDFGARIRHIKTVDPAVIESIRNGLHLVPWRRQHAKALDTGYISLIRNDLYDFDHPLTDVVQPVVRDVRDAYPGCIVWAVVFMMMPPNTRYVRHIDSHRLHEFTHTVHTPITSDPACRFEIDNEWFHLPVGEITEINNRRYHTVVNDSPIFRTHLITLMMPADRALCDPARRTFHEQTQAY